MQRSSSLITPPGALYNIIPTAGQHTQLQRNYGSYKDAVRPTKNVNSDGKSTNPNVTNDSGTNNQAMDFQRTFLTSQTTCTSFNNLGIPTPWSTIETAFAKSDPDRHAEFVSNGGLGPLVVNLGPL